MTVTTPYLQIRLSNRTIDNKYINSSDGYELLPDDYGVNELVFGSDMEIGGVSRGASVNYIYHNPHSAAVGLNSSWNSIKNIEAKSSAAGDVTFRNFVHTDVTLGDGGDSTVNIFDAKRGFIVTGDGNDTINIEAKTNNSGWSNTFVVQSGEGNDVIQFSADKNITTSVIDAGQGNDTVSTIGEYHSSEVLLGDGDDIFLGGDGSDTVNGGAGNDVITGGKGNDTLNGGEGEDTALFEGNYADYSVQAAGDEILVSGISNGQGRDTLSSIEFITFNDVGFVNGMHLSDDFVTGLEDTVISGNVLDNNGSGEDRVIKGLDFDVVASNLTTALGATVVISANGDFTYTPVSNYSGLDSFAYSVKTGYGILQATVSVSIENVNDIPMARDDVFNTNEDEVHEGNLLADNGNGEDFDIDSGDMLSVVAGTYTTLQGGEIVIAENGDFTYTPYVDFYGSDSFTYTLMDRHGESATGTASFDVAPMDEVMHGVAGNDHLTGSHENDFIYGGDSSDIISGGAGDDFLRGQNGDDLLYGEEGEDILRGGSGNDILDGGDGNDKLYGAEGDDVLTGGSGDDLIFGDAGTDEVQYGSDIENYLFTFVDTNTVVIEDSSGSEGSDSAIDIELFTFNGITYTYSELQQTGYRKNLETFYVSMDTDSTEFNYQSDTHETVVFTDTTMDLGDSDESLVELNRIGNSLVITLLDADVPDTISFGGQSGNDFLALMGVSSNVQAEINGNGGDDVITIGDDVSGVFLLRGGEGSDTITGSLSGDNIRGGTGDDEISGRDGEDIIWGDEGNDEISGGAGDDQMEGDGGDDTLNGDEGNDRLEGEAGSDTLNGGAGDDILIGGEDNDTLNGDGGNDQIWGQTGDDGLYGNDGFDMLFGGDGNDTLDGGAGDDTLEGGDGDDLLIAGRGRDSLIGGSGSDEYAFTALEDQNNNIFGFSMGEDTLNITDILEGYDSDTHAIEDFVLMIAHNSNRTTFKINADGDAGGDFENLAQIKGADFTGLGVQDLIDNATLITNQSVIV